MSRKKAQVTKMMNEFSDSKAIYFVIFVRFCG